VSFEGIRSKMMHGNSVVETPRLAECVGEVRLLLRQILSESSRYCSSTARKHCAAGTRPASSLSCEVLREQILVECHTTFTACFHAFYPTNNLKWSCLCDLLASSDPVSHGLCINSNNNNNNNNNNSDNHNSSYFKTANN